MRTSTCLALGATVLASLGAVAVGCGSSSTCEERGDCVSDPCADPNYAASYPAACPDAGGTRGTGGTAGTGGDSGTDATGGTAGSSGTGGSEPGDAADEDQSTGGTGGDADADAEAGEDVYDAAEEPEAFWCNPAWEPSDNDCVIDEEFGIFASPTGADSATCGAKNDPCKTIGQAMTRAKAEGKRVYACGDGGSYEESIAVDAALGGLTVFGGFHCGSWAYEPSAVRSGVMPSDGASALVVSGVSALDMRDFAFESRDATGAGASSITARVAGSTGVVFRNTTFKAGNGAAGTKGVAGAAGEVVPVVGTDQKGHDSTCGTANPNGGGAWLTAFTCAAGGSTRGGAGGTATYELPGNPGQPGTPNTNVVTPGMGQGGPGGTDTDKAGKPGQTGSAGNAGANGAAAAASGSLSESGYTPADGMDGTNGAPGQGGGGSGASWSFTGCVGPSGGAGGLGGCGGFKGTKGTGGGASIALLAWDSGVTLEQCTLTAGDGGKGGDGGNGGAASNGRLGAPGGFDATGDTASAGQAGPGGKGGNGGSGSGGTGGPSYAVVHHGTAPVNSGSTFAFGSGGGIGKGGSVGGAFPAPDGTVGAAGEMLGL